MSKFAVFNISGEEFGIELGRIAEIIKFQKSTPLPKVPAFISGVVNIRGDVIPLVDLRKRLGVEPSHIQGRIIITKIHEEKIGLLVDAVKEIVSIEKESIASTPSFFKGLKSEYIMGIGKVAERLIVILNLDNLLSSEEMILLEEHKETLRLEDAKENPSQAEEEKDKDV